MNTIYLDHAATTPLEPAVLEEMRPYFTDVFGNPSSIHTAGRASRDAVESARHTIAGAIDANDAEVVFTSGGTESNNNALYGMVPALRRMNRTHLLVSAIEHHAILEPAEHLRAEGFEVEEVPVTPGGVIDPEQLRQRIRPDTGLISVMHSNNEIGTIQPLKKIAEIAHEQSIFVHSDAVQSLGKIPLSMSDLDVDLVSFSAHKLYGPKGVGALFIRTGIPLAPFIRGGSQQGNRRGGTENVPLVVGFRKAIEIARERMERDAKRLAYLRDLLWNEISRKCEGVVVNGDAVSRLPNILSVSFDSKIRGVDGDALIMGMDLRGIAVTSGSACTSGSLTASHVLLALGRDVATARATVRFSLGRMTTEDHITAAVDALVEVLKTAAKGT